MSSAPIKPQYFLHNLLQHVRNNKNQENGSNELTGHAPAMNPESVINYGIDRPSRNG